MNPLAVLNGRALVGNGTLVCVRVALVDSGLGLVSFADALGRQRPDVGLILAMDPEFMPYGSLTPAQVCDRILASARACMPYRPDAVVVACNTGSVHALDVLRAELEPGVPVVGTVPAIRPAAAAAAAGGGTAAIWATLATTNSEYEQRLIDEYAAGVEVQKVACPGLAEAIEAGEDAAIDAAVAEAAARTSPAPATLVLGCTHYGLVADRITTAVPGAAIFDSPEAVARQTLRRLAMAPAPEHEPVPLVAVLQSGRPCLLPAVLNRYARGRRLLARWQPTE